MNSYFFATVHSSYITQNDCEGGQSELACFASCSVCGFSDFYLTQQSRTSLTGQRARTQHYSTSIILLYLGLFFVRPGRPFKGLAKSQLRLLRQEKPLAPVLNESLSWNCSGSCIHNSKKSFKGSYHVRNCKSLGCLSVGLAV